MGFSARLADLGLALPGTAAPVANYVPYKIFRHQLFISGMIPILEGKPLMSGHVGAEVSIEQAQHCARQCVLNALAWVDEALQGNSDRVLEVLQLRGLVACPPDFTQHPAVINGASDLLVAVFGDHGRHTRVAAGVSSLPLGVPVEIDFLFAINLA